jgi:CRISPR-associated protein Cas1
MGDTKTTKRAVLLSKRANIFLLERVKVQVNDNRVVYLTDTMEPIEKLFNIPEKNTIVVLLGQGTSITSRAARMLAESGVLVGFCGTGGSPFLSEEDMTFLPYFSEYRPVEYMQQWASLWFDETRRLSAAKKLLSLRLEYAENIWAKLGISGIVVPGSLLDKVESGIAAAKTTTELLSIEGNYIKQLYQYLAEKFGAKDFARVHTHTTDRDKMLASMPVSSQKVNKLLTIGNYFAYGAAGSVLTAMGISYAFPLLHGKTRRGGLVFDLADPIKDAFVLPLAFSMQKQSPKEFRDELSSRFVDHLVMDDMFDFIEKILANDKNKRGCETLVSGLTEKEAHT